MESIFSIPDSNLIGSHSQSIRSVSRTPDREYLPTSLIPLTFNHRRQGRGSYPPSQVKQGVDIYRWLACWIREDGIVQMSLLEHHRTSCGFLTVPLSSTVRNGISLSDVVLVLYNDDLLWGIMQFVNHFKPL